MGDGSTTAILIERHGPPETLVEREVRLPDPGPGEVQLRVEAAGVNFADLLMRTGIYATVPPMPYSPGFEVAGVIDRVGSRAGDWSPGERAVALMRFGGYARDVIVSAPNLFRYPASLTPVEAASIPVAFLTAWVAIHETARARKGETVLVLNAAGGVGSAAVQLGVRLGMRVIGTAGTEAKCEFVRSLSATACFDSAGPWEAQVKGLAGERSIDVALDAVGGLATHACRRLLAPLGRLVFYGLSDAMPGQRRNVLQMALAWLRTPRFHPLSLIEPNIGIAGIHLLHLQAREGILRPMLEQIYSAVAAGELRPVVDRTFPLDRVGAVAAHHYLHRRQVLGKVVLAGGPVA